MQRYLIIAMNGTLLALLLIGLPAATHVQFGDWQIASASAGRQLLVWGLAIGATGNLLSGQFLVKGRKGRILCWEWAAVFIGILLVYWGLALGYFSFDWLKQILFWLRNHL